MANAGTKIGSALDRATLFGRRKAPRFKRRGASCEEAERQEPPHAVSVPHELERVLSADLSGCG